MVLRIDNRPVSELRVARSDGALVKVGEARIWDGQWRTVFTSVVPAVLLRTDLLTSAGSHTVTPPAGAGFFAAVLVGGGGSGGISATFATPGGGGGAGAIIFRTGVTPPAGSLKIGAGGASRSGTSLGAGTAGSATTWGAEWSAAGGAAGATTGNVAGGTNQQALVTPEWLVWAAPDTEVMVGPGGSAIGAAGTRGGGGAGGKSGGQIASGAGGVGWVKIWWWTSDPTQAPPSGP